jgi:hypothetical protein
MDFQLQKPAKTPPVAGDKGGHDYWKAIDDVALEVCQVLDEKEDWVMEAHPDFRVMLDRLINAVRDSPEAANYCLTNPRESLKLLAWLHTSTAMMLLHYAEEDRRELVVRFLEAVQGIRETENRESEVYRAAGLAIERFLVFERSALIRRVFSTTRVKSILSALHKARLMNPTFESHSAAKEGHF